jgi:hypothetical protein
VFLDYFSLDQRIGDSSLSQVLEDDFVSPGKSDLFRSVATGSTVVVLLPKRDTIQKTSSSFIPFSRQFPNDFELVTESGRSLNRESVVSNWKWYFDISFKWHNHIAGKPGEYEYGDETFVYEYEGVAKNAAEELLASRVLFHRVVEPSVPTHQKDLEQLPGEITFLPVIKDWSPDDLVKEILDEFTDLDARIKSENSPDWVDEKMLPGEEEAVAELSDLRERKAEIEQEIDEKNEKLNEYERYKALLWGNEDVLEQLVPEVFREMGFDVEGEEPHGRDGMIYLNGKRLVLEITGTTGGISDGKCRQLSAWVDDLELEDQSHDYTGLLVVNPDRKTPPGNRNWDGFLPPHLRDFLNKRDFHVLLTPDLYHVLSDYRDGELDSEDIEELLLSDDLIL